jgi:glutathione S-transferase
MLTLYHAPQSRSTRLIWLLEELGADYAIRYVTIRYNDGRGGAPDPANLHPDKKVPALVHDDALITESTAMTIYLCDLYPPAGLAPTVGDPDRGPFLTWMCWNDNELGAAVLARMFGQGDTPMVRAGYDAAVRRLTAALEAGPYLMGETFTAVDVMVGPLLAFGRKHLPESDAIDAYVARITSRPAFARAKAKEMPAAQAA